MRRDRLLSKRKPNISGKNPAMWRIRRRERGAARRSRQCRTAAAYANPATGLFGPSYLFSDTLLERKGNYIDIEKRSVLKGSTEWGRQKFSLYAIGYYTDDDVLLQNASNCTYIPSHRFLYSVYASVDPPSSRFSLFAITFVPPGPSTCTPFTYKYT